MVVVAWRWFGRIIIRDVGVTAAIVTRWLGHGEP